MIKVKITYCEECMFRPRAEKIRDIIEKSFKGVNITLEEGHHGVFDVRLEGDLIFSMHKELRFPSEEEIIDNIKKKTRNK